MVSHLMWLESTLSLNAGRTVVLTAFCYGSHGIMQLLRSKYLYADLKDLASKRKQFYLPVFLPPMHQVLECKMD